MNQLIQMDSYVVKTTIDTLLQDKTTKHNIIWATKSYEKFGPLYSDRMEISRTAILGLNSGVLQPRVTKALEQQQERTKAKAEVFTPTWICNKMNNYLDEDWFGRPNVFNVEKDNTWETNDSPIEFPQNREWKKYIDCRKLEITCGEAPYLVSRYDATTGELIDVKDRVGILDRKLRIVNENTTDEKEWLKWAVRSYESTYGYEFQGDNLLIARINLLQTFADNLEFRWNRLPSIKELSKIANIISWNVWQMDGLTGTVPLGVPQEHIEEISLFDFDEDFNIKEKPEQAPLCKIWDWRLGNAILFNSIKQGGNKNEI